jgi:proline dehydrogenase
MNLMRSILLAGSESQWLRQTAPRLGFVRKAVTRFMPGETLEEILPVAREYESQGVQTVFTKLGENVKDRDEARAVSDHYREVLAQVRAQGLATEVSVKLTQLGLDLDPDFCFENLLRIVEASEPSRPVWVDMESSPYVDVTLKLYEKVLAKHPHTGVCLQAYLYRTADDIRRLKEMGGAVRLVKGAYREPESVAFPKKADVDRNFYDLACQLLDSGMRTVMATHDTALIARICRYAEQRGLAKDSFAFTMLYGIQRAEQFRLAREGWRSKCLIAYGSYWFPWYMRRLAERPANVWFVAKNMIR